MAGGDTTELGRSLRAARVAAGIRQVDVTAKAKISQSRLSRIEQGNAVPTEADIVALGGLYRLDPAERDRLLALARDTLAGVHDTRLIVQRGATLAMQQKWRRLERESTLIRSFHPAVVLGVLQTAAYASAIIDDPKTVADRQARRDALLTRSSPRYVLIQTEGALRYRVRSAEVMVEQLDAIAEASDRPNVEFGLIPARQPAQVVPTCGFHLYDMRETTTVVVGLEVAAATLTESADVAYFTGMFERLRRVAVWGDQARAELRRIGADTK